MTHIKRHNWKSDLTQTEHFFERNADGTLVAALVPDDAVDFQLVYRTTKQSPLFIADRIKGVYRNCEKINPSTLVVYIPLSRRSLGIGALSRELILTTANNKFLDAICNIVIPGYTGIDLWEGPTDTSTVVDADIVTPIFVQYPQSYLPQTRLKKNNRFSVKVSLAEPCPLPVQKLLFVGVFHKSKGKWRLACDVTKNKYIGIGAKFGVQYPLTAAKLDTYRKQFKVSPIPFNPQIARNVTDLFKLEFIQMSALGEVAERNDKINTTLDRTEFFVTTRQNSKLMRGVSRHNTTEYTIKEDVAKFIKVKIDKTYKGAKQVIKRHYKVGVVRPKTYNIDGTPNWGAYYVGLLHDITVIGRTTGRKQGLLKKPQTEIFIEMT